MNIFGFLIGLSIALAPQAAIKEAKSLECQRLEQATYLTLYLFLDETAGMGHIENFKIKTYGSTCAPNNRSSISTFRVDFIRKIETPSLLPNMMGGSWAMDHFPLTSNQFIRVRYIAMLKSIADPEIPEKGIFVEKVQIRVTEIELLPTAGD